MYRPRAASRHLPLAALCCWLFAASASAATPLPDAARALLPPAHHVLSYAEGDFDHDGHRDYVIAAGVDDETQRTANDSDGAGPARPLLVVFGDGQGRFHLVARNDAVVMHADRGYQCDPFTDSGDGLAVSGTFFTVQNQIACGQHWTDYITFRYDRSAGEFRFHKRIAQDWQANPDRAEDAEALVLASDHVTRADPARPISLQAWHDTP
jgi:hypothetical protein